MQKRYVCLNKYFFRVLIIEKYLVFRFWVGGQYVRDPNVHMLSHPVNIN